MQISSSWLDNKHLLSLVFGLVTGGVLLTYLVINWQAGNGHLLMPLDDVYIHFQYARQMALGEPYVYNSGGDPTSGATSFLYPFVLAAGYLVGFRELWPGLWAMLVGAAALFVSLWAVYLLVRDFDAPRWLALLSVLSFGLTGSVAWHFMSGMETGLMMAFTLLTLLFFVRKQLPGFVIAATLLALTRPEGSAMAVMAAALMLLRLWSDVHHTDKQTTTVPGRWRLLWLLVPVLALGLQPLVNNLVSGSAVATGNQAKSILGMLPPDASLILARILENFLRMWRELLTDSAPTEGWYLPVFTGVSAIAGALSLLFKKNWRLVGLLVISWLLTVTGAVSTLDTAFWHFKRYQMPLMALFFPLAAWGVTFGLRRVDWLRYPVYVFDGLIVPVWVGLLFVQFAGYQATNVNYVYQQPYLMSQWLQANTPDDALIAVHDVGLMRYAGERDTLDIVGLTTSGAAAAWRNGPGSVAEFLMQQQPDYIASYGAGHGYGLYLLEETALYGEPLAVFEVQGWQRWKNVSLAADRQGIYQPDWSRIHDEVTQSVYQPPNTEPLLRVDVAHLASESAAGYTWNSQTVPGFITEVQQFGADIGAYRVLSTGRESFELSTDDINGDALLVTRVHARSAGTLTIYADETRLAERWIPAIPGAWFDVPTRIPANNLSDNTVAIRIEATVTDGLYMPALHEVYSLHETNRYTSAASLTETIATFQDGAFGLLLSDVTLDNERLSVSLSTVTPDGQAAGDYRFFLHLYDDINAPPVAQTDTYFGGQLPGNWLAGTLSDTFMLDVSGLDAGTYQLAAGFYGTAAPHERLIPAGDNNSSNGRIWLQEVEIE